MSQTHKRDTFKKTFERHLQIEAERTKTLNRLRRNRIGRDNLLKKQQKEKEKPTKPEMHVRVIQFNIRATAAEQKQRSAENKKEDPSEAASHSRELAHQPLGLNFGRSKGSMLEVKHSTDRPSPTSRQAHSSSTPKVLVKASFRVGQPPAADESYFSKYNSRRKSRNREIEVTLSHSQETHRKRTFGSFKESVHQVAEEKKMLKILEKKQKEPVIKLEASDLNSYASGGVGSALLESLHREKQSQAQTSKQLNLKAIEVPKSKVSVAASRRSASRSSRQRDNGRSDPSQSPSVSIAVEEDLKSRGQTNASRSESRKTRLLLKRNSSFDRKLILKRLQVAQACLPLVKKLEFYKRSFRSNSPSSKSVRSQKKSREKIVVEDAFCIEVSPQQVEPDPTHLLSEAKRQSAKQPNKKSQRLGGKQLLGFKSEVRNKDQPEPRSPAAAAGLRRSVIVKPHEKSPKDENYLSRFTTGLLNTPKSFLRSANLLRQKSQDKPVAKQQPAKLKDYSSPSIKKHLEHTLKSFKSKV